RDGAIAKCLRSAGIFGEARRRISERAGGGALPLHRESRFAARVRVVLASGPLPNVGASRRRGARRWTSLAADIRARWRDLLAFLPHPGSDARFSDGHARLRHPDLAGRGGGVRPVALSQAGRSRRRDWASRDGGVRAVSGYAGDCIGIAVGGSWHEAIRAPP